jgi:hypothetical protein
MSVMAVQQWLKVRALDRGIRIWRGQVVRNLSHERDKKIARVASDERVYHLVMKRWSLRTVFKQLERTRLQRIFATWRDRLSLVSRFYGTCTSLTM